VGHLFGGYYFFPGDNLSVEGQADYFAGEVCIKKVFATFPQRNPLFRSAVPAVVKAKCDSTWKATPQQDLCYRSAAAGFSLATLLSTIGSGPKPSFMTPDRTQVPQTFTDHPAAQCRLDTYFAGAVCNAPWDPKVIPGLGLPTGNNSVDAEAAAYKVSCSGQSIGARPACWFHSQATAQLFRR
jgi:hypothetical protein